LRTTWQPAKIVERNRQQQEVRDGARRRFDEGFDVECATLAALEEVYRPVTPPNTRNGQRVSNRTCANERWRAGSSGGGSIKKGDIWRFDSAEQIIYKSAFSYIMKKYLPEGGFCAPDVR
jgi:hypothetical protein